MESTFHGLKGGVTPTAMGDPATKATMKTSKNVAVRKFMAG
jgi:hypothetical protein